MQQQVAARLAEEEERHRQQLAAEATAHREQLVAEASAHAKAFGQLEAQLAQAQRAAAVADRQVPFVALIFQLLLPSVIMMLYHMRHYKQIFRNGH